MSDATLPRTGVGISLGTIGGVTIGLPQLGVGLLLAGVALVVGSALVVRIAFRRRRRIGQA
jgi:hypothetical protein